MTSPEFTDTTNESVVVLPLANPHPVIYSGSGIVAIAQPSGGYILDFEGNRYGAVNLVRYGDRVHNALGRQQVRYPTAARHYVKDLSEYQVIGRFNANLGHVELLDAPGIVDALQSWLGVEHLEGAELEASSYQFEVRRQLRAMTSTADPAAAMSARLWARQRGIEL